MRYLPHTNDEISAMLATIGARDVDDLFSTLPADCRRTRPLKLPEAMTEWELNRHMDTLAGRMAAVPRYNVFMGAGSYDHFIPASVSYLLGRSEFSTAYTPYQPEISQGTLQAIYEYQTLVTRLLGMDVANASMYDGASALAEALLMAIRITRRTTVAVSRAIHPLYRRVVQTYLQPTGYKVIELDYGSDGRTDLGRTAGLPELAAIALQSPNFFGCIEDLQSAAQTAHADGKTLLVACFTEPLGLRPDKKTPTRRRHRLRRGPKPRHTARPSAGPGWGCSPRNGPSCAACRADWWARPPIARADGGFVLTLQTREQHIRREKATSNICSNQGLCATTAAMYMASLGGTGLQELAQLNYDKCTYLQQALQRAGLKLPFAAPIFNEFVVTFPAGFDRTYQNLLKRKIVAGLALDAYYPELAGSYLLCVTETLAKEDLDGLVKEVTA